MKAYKLVRKLKSGELSPLFINKKLRIPLHEWLEAEEHSTKGFKTRKGWHCTLKKEAPHLSVKNRVWVEVQVEDFKLIERPISQGGTWLLANKIKFIKECEN
jgi:hypothetical protein